MPERVSTGAIDPTLEVERSDETLRLRFSGPLRIGRAGPVIEEARAAFEARLPGVKRIELDLVGATPVEAGPLALLVKLERDLRDLGLEAEVTGLTGPGQTLLELLDLGEQPPLHTPPVGESLFTQVGDATVSIVLQIAGILAFLGDMIVAFGRALRRPRLVNWPDTWRIMETAGADGFPIVFLMNFLVGLVMGFQGAIQLKQFGADILVADLVGLVQVRELGPLMTAIIVAGRSGAAFAAELGTMKVSEEVDALHTLGLDRYHFLVFPRVLALVCVVPILTLIGDLVGVVGGLVVGITSLDLTTNAYLIQTQGAIDLWDVGSGLLKSVFFAGAIALIACQRGLSARGGAEGVGRSTTSAVVAAIFSIVVIDSVFSVLFHILGL